MSPPRAPVLLAALLGLHCNAELEVLVPGDTGGIGGGASETVGSGAGGHGAICGVEGAACSGASDCCSGACEPGSSVCAASAACAMANGEECVRQAGEPCDDEHRCCTGACSPGPDGDKRCAYLGGCHQQCEICNADTECCSGSCAPDGSGVRRCAPPVGATCVARGELCEGGDCCGECVKVDPPYGPKRCEDVPDVDPQADGAPCSLPDQCKGGLCAPADGGGFQCASACRANGASCAARSDCCDPATHDCLPVGGSPKCVIPPG